MHPLTFRILLVLQDGPADGSTIVGRLDDLPEGAAPSLPTLYRCLREAIEQGWVTAAGGTEGGGPGRPRRLFTITDDGEAAVHAEALRMREIAGLVLDRTAGRRLRSR